MEMAFTKLLRSITPTNTMGRTFAFPGQSQSNLFKKNIQKKGYRKINLADLKR